MKSKSKIENLRITLQAIEKVRYKAAKLGDAKVVADCDLMAKDVGACIVREKKYGMLSKSEKAMEVYKTAGDTAKAIQRRREGKLPLISKSESRQYSKIENLERISKAIRSLKAQAEFVQARDSISISGLLISKTRSAKPFNMVRDLSIMDKLIQDCIAAERIGEKMVSKTGTYSHEDKINLKKQLEFLGSQRGRGGLPAKSPYELVAEAAKKILREMKQ